MKKTTKTKRLPCGMVSLKMFQINHSKALIIAYLNMRGGLKKYTFNKTDISNQTDIGDTVVRQCLKELVTEGVLNRKGKSFYQLNRQRMEELYYEASESDNNESESDMDASENDIQVSESDTEVSETDAIHSSNLNSRKLESSDLDTSENKVPEPSPTIKEFLSRSPKEQIEWLNRIEANKTMEKDLRSGKEVMMTAQFEKYFANM